MVLKKKIRKIIPSHENTVESLRLGIILAMVGGFIHKTATFLTF